MKILNITSEFREGFAVTASLSLRGYDVFYMQIGSRYAINQVKLQLDTGLVTVKFIEVPIVPSKHYISTLQWLFMKKISDLDIVITSSGYTSFNLARAISKVYQVPLIVRVSDLGTIGKFKEALKLFHYYRVMPELPFHFLRLYKSITSSDMVIAHTNLISKIIERRLLVKNLLIYPTYAKVITRNSLAVPETINDVQTSVSSGEHLILGIASVRRHGLAGRHDKKALECLYTIAKYNPTITVAVIGTEYNEARMILGKNALPSNLKLLGIIRNDFILEYLYKRASLIVVPFFFRKTISNRLLEALFYGRPTLISSYLKEDFPMLKHGENTYMFNECNELPHLVRYILKSDDILNRLEEGAKKIWKKEFSNSIFGLKMSLVLKSFSDRESS